MICRNCSRTTCRRATEGVHDSNLLGYDSPIIRIDHIPENDTLTQSWGVLFADKYAGKTALRDDAYQSIMVTGLHLGHKDPAQ